MTDLRVLVAVATYKRPESLDRLLDSFEAMTPPTNAQITILVIDNDVSGAARPVVEKYQRVQYDLEPEPGIAAARNRALLNMGEYDFVAFVDDDESVSRHWLIHLIAAATSWGCDAVAGPAVPIYPDNTPEDILVDGFFEPAALETGALLDVCSTCNVLVKVSALSRLSHALFDEDFGLTGGEDTELFTRLQESGGTFRWCSDAIVYDYIAPERVQRKWIKNRLIRYGNGDGRIALRRQPAIRVAAGAVARLVLGFPSYAFVAIVRPARQSSKIATFLRGVGMLRAVLHSHSVEYSR